MEHFDVIVVGAGSAAENGYRVRLVYWLPVAQLKMATGS